VGLAGGGGHGLLVSANGQLEVKLPKLPPACSKLRFLSWHQWCVCLQVAEEPHAVPLVCPGVTVTSLVSGFVMKGLLAGGQLRLSRLRYSRAAFALYSTHLVCYQPGA